MGLLVKYLSISEGFFVILIVVEHPLFKDGMIESLSRNDLRYDVVCDSMVMQNGLFRQGMIIG